VPRIIVRPATTAEDRDRVAEIWSATNRARERPAGALRASRVRDKMDDAELLLLARYGDRPAGALVAERFVADGADSPDSPDSPDSAVGGDGSDPATAHVAMVCVHPALWGSGIGTALLRDLQAREWDRLSAWFRDDNRRARRLFATAGFTDTGRRAHLQDGDVIQQWCWSRASRL
jgi:ribosomal protein S18 acetylase RimI-like enzyme